MDGVDCQQMRKQQQTSARSTKVWAMRSDSRFVKRRLWSLGLLVPILCLIWTGCRTDLVLRALRGKQNPTGIRFSHEQHLGGSLTCGLCHQFLSYLDPHRPPERVCVFCHDIGSHTEPAPSCTVCHTRSDFAVLDVTRPGFEDSRFGHEAHTVMGISCKNCHREQDKARSYLDSSVPFMQDCISCHEEMGARRSCETCHHVWREDAKPENHYLDWAGRHGRFAVDGFGRDCTYCHSKEEFCLDCHMASTPSSHTLFFRNRGHGFQAETDRGRCLTCHKQDFCLRCHGPEGEVTPPSHVAAFGGRRPYLHCINCHFPSGDAYGCAACHRAGTIHVKHLEATEARSGPIPPIASESSLNCLNACHPYDRVLPPHPLGALSNADCLRCHVP